MNTKGIDISGYNVVTSYEKVAADHVDFAILKIIRKDLQPDKLFEKHWKGCEAVGIPIQGVYNYSYAKTVEKFQSDARRVLAVLHGRKIMVWLDIEDKSLIGLGRTLVDGIRAYAEVIQRAGLQFGVYTYLSFWNSCMRSYASSLNFPFWIARYPSARAVDYNQNPDAGKCPNIGKTLYGWQYSSKGIVEGINGYVDLNEWYVKTEAENAVAVVPMQQELYIESGFRRDLAAALGLSRDASAEQVLAATLTIGERSNRCHPAVTALERLLKEKGYYTGAIEADSGQQPIFGNGMAKATALYQAKEVGLARPDKEWTARNRTYKKALLLT